MRFGVVLDRVVHHGEVRALAGEAATDATDLTMA
ncbi:hypothetical protein P3T36_000943 [Kitasatospora sp. MAP12-15]|nr:hypothetical protein [Kitasatospora sp. MAP12-44]